MAQTGPDPAPAVTVAAALRRAAGRIDRREARLLLARALSRRPEWLIAHDDDPLDAASLRRFDALLDRRARGEPVAYLFGEREFHGRPFAVGPSVLIPRPETELLVATLRAMLPAARPGTRLRLLDLGTGSGIIAITLAALRDDADVVAVDASAAALDTARRNAHAHGLTARLHFVQADWNDPGFDALLPAGGAFDAIASNPPYIAGDDPHLLRGDLRFEPREALTPGPLGDEALAVLARRAPRLLRPGAPLAFEHGHDQGPRCRALLAAQALDDVHTLRDDAGLERVTVARRGPGIPNLR